MSASLCLLVALTLAAPKHHPASKHEDLSAQGYAEYEDGNYAKAVATLKKAAQQSPKNALVWFNLGRATAAGGQDVNGGDDCNEEKAWKYLSMKAFNRALAIDREEILGKLKQSDPKYALFRDTAEYRKWIKAQGPMPRSEGDLAKFYAGEASWFLPVGDTVFMDLEPGGAVQRYGPTDDDHGDAEGRWRVKKGVLEVTLNDGKVQRYQLIRGPYSWQLKGPEGHWEPGPILRDCTQKK